jgi:hypothetical protein
MEHPWTGRLTLPKIGGIIKMNMRYIIWIVLSPELITINNVEAAAYGSGWHFEAQASSAYASNISRSEDSYPVIEDTVSSVGGGIGYADMFSENTRYSLSSYVDYNRFAQKKGLSRTAVSVMGQVIYQPSIGYENLWYQVSLALTRLDHRQAQGRDGDQALLDLGVNRHMSMATTGRLGYRLRQFSSTHNANRQSAYDQVSQQLYAGLEVDLVSDGAVDLALVAEYGFSWGDMLASGPDNLLVGLPVDAISPDPALTLCGASGCRTWSAYRNDGRLQTLDVGLVLVVDQVSIDLTTRCVDMQTNPQGSYQGWQVQLGAVWAR